MTWPFGLLRPSTYQVIYADPAWQYQGYTSEGVPQRSKDQHYPTMHVEDLARLPVHKLAAPEITLSDIRDALAFARPFVEAVRNEAWTEMYQSGLDVSEWVEANPHWPKIREGHAKVRRALEYLTGETE